MTDGREVVFDLPIIPRPRRWPIALVVPVFALFGLIWLNFTVGPYLLGPPAHALRNALSLIDNPAGIAKVLGGLAGMALMLPFWMLSAYWLEKLGSYAWLALARRPMLEIHADYLIDRRELNRSVAWAELGNGRSVGVFDKFPLPVEGYLTLLSAEPLRHGFCSWVRSLWYRRPLTYVDTSLFDVDASLLDEVIATMIRNANRPGTPPP